MKPHMFTTLAAAAMALAAQGAPQAAHAVTLETNGNTLTGALDVYVNGLFYDVTFEPGQFSSIQPFTFTTPSTAQVAANALLTQVGVSTFNGAIDGCDEAFALSETCDIDTPFAINSNTAVVGLFETIVPTPDGGGGTVALTTAPASSYAAQTSTLAVWTPVPEPASASLLLMGVAGGIAARAKRRRNKK